MVDMVLDSFKRGLDKFREEKFREDIRHDNHLNSSCSRIEEVESQHPRVLFQEAPWIPISTLNKRY